MKCTMCTAFLNDRKLIACLFTVISLDAFFSPIFQFGLVLVEMQGLLRHFSTPTLVSFGMH